MLQAAFGKCGDVRKKKFRNQILAKSRVGKQDNNGY
jgi:hypothetical protein